MSKTQNLFLNVYISANFPTTPGAFDTTINGGEDGFVVKVNPAGDSLVYASFLGGSADDTSWVIALNEWGNAYVAGYAGSANFPVTADALDPTHNGNFDLFFVSFNASGSGLDYGTFLGGTAAEVGYSLIVDSLGQVYMAGFTGSPEFPTTPGAFDTTYNGDMTDSFVVKLAPVYEAVQADFSGFPTSGPVPLNVAFLNASTGNFLSCVWSFGDGGTSNDCADPAHEFITVGVYTVSLTISGPGGTDALTQPGYVTVNQPTVANFSGTPTSGVAPLTVTFSNLSVGSFQSCLWEFGDGATSAACYDPEHIYEAPGSYTVSLTVYAPGVTASEMKTDYITVAPQLLFLPVLTRPQ